MLPHVIYLNLKKGKLKKKIVRKTEVVSTERCALTLNCRTSRYSTVGEFSYNFLN